MKSERFTVELMSLQPLTEWTTILSYAYSILTHETNVKAEKKTTKKKTIDLMGRTEEKPAIVDTIFFSSLSISFLSLANTICVNLLSSR